MFSYPEDTLTCKRHTYDIHIHTHTSLGDDSTGAQRHTNPVIDYHRLIEFKDDRRSKMIADRPIGSNRPQAKASPVRPASIARCLAMCLARVHGHGPVAKALPTSSNIFQPPSSCKLHPDHSAETPLLQQSFQISNSVWQSLSIQSL